MSAPVALDERALLEALRDGDESAFTALVEAQGGPMLMRLALMHVPSRAVAEELVQETGLAVLNGIDRFAGRFLAEARGVGPPESLSAEASEHLLRAFRDWRGSR